MSTNQLYDVVVIGASEEGISFCTQLLARTVGVKIALVSRSFNRAVELKGLTKINKEVIFSSYSHGLISLVLSDQSQIFSSNVVIAVGTKPLKSNLKNCSIKYNLNDLKPSKSSPIVMAGNDELAVAYALKLSKKFKYVYLCSSTIELDCSLKQLKKLENAANIVHLPNCNIINCKNDKDGNLVEVQLDTYSSIKCTGLVMSLGRIPDVSGLSKRMIVTDSKGYIITKEFNETTIVPGIYAIGTCTESHGKGRLLPVVKRIIEKNKFKLKEG